VSITDLTRSGTHTARWTRSLVVAAIIGVGLMAALEQIVFHQVLGWHHFYDGSTPEDALLTDGLMHAGELVVLVTGFMLLAGLQRRRGVVPRAARAGLLVGAGLYLLLDGVGAHVLLRLHQIRYGVDLFFYDIAWIGAGALLLLLGVMLAVRSRSLDVGWPAPSYDR
jgi:uncharacterized membrane protein